MNWVKHWFCSECHKRLGYLELFDSHGVCSYCGHNSGGEVCSHYTKVARWIVTKEKTWYSREEGRWMYKDEFNKNAHKAFREAKSASEIKRLSCMYPLGAAYYIMDLKKMIQDGGVE